MPPVPRIVYDIGPLLNHRRDELSRIFLAISANSRRINFVNASLSGSIICGFNDSLDPGSQFRNWRFKTICDDINANYFEIWKQSTRNQYFLERSYLQLYKKTSDAEYEYFHLHCDASEPDDTPHAKYKQSLHIHVEAAEHPIPRAHIALYNGRLEFLRNITSFNAALSESVLMIKSQLLERLLLV
jgi:hypothetical protein